MLGLIPVFGPILDVIMLPIAVLYSSNPVLAALCLAVIF